MNNNTKILIGAGVGAGIGWFIGAVIAEMIAIKCDGGELHMEELEELTDDEDQDFNILERNQTKLKNNQKQIKNYTQYFIENGRPDLAELAKKYNVKEADPEDETIHGMEPTSVIEDEFETIDEIPAYSDRPVKIISLSEYANDDMGFEAVTLHYYDDDVLTDENDIPIDRPEQLIGEDALVSFGEFSDDEDVVYVRNTPKKALYEIVRLNKVYASSPSRTRRRDRIDRMGEKEREENGKEDNSA